VEERRHRHLPAAADLAQQVLLRHLDVGEEDLVELRLAGDLAERAHLDAGRLHVDDQVGEPLVALRVRIATADKDAVVGDVSERRPDLLAVDDERAVLSLDRGANCREVGSGARLREALAPDLLGRKDLRQVATLLLLGSVRHDRWAGHAEPDHAHVLRRLRPGELLEHDRLVAVRCAAAAVLLGPGQAGVARLVHLPAPLPRVARRQVLLEPRANLGAKCGLVGAVAKVHSA
jgi:hypothetical protein